MADASEGLAEAKRLAAVKRFEILDTPPEGAFDRITALAARVFDVPVAVISIVDGDRVWFKSHHGTELTELSREPGLFSSAILQDDNWVAEDAAQEALTHNHSLVAGSFGLRFFAAAPLRVRGGTRIGTLSIMDREPRSFTRTQGRVLRDLAAIVVREMEVRLESLRAMRESRDLRAGYRSTELDPRRG
jgi:GAF domain-containing protein